MGERNVFEEVLQGLHEIKDFERGKITLRTSTVKAKPMTELTGDQIKQIREALGISRTVFAHQLRVSKRTLENWEQGRAEPNDQAKALILMAAKYPDTIERLQAI